MYLIMRSSDVVNYIKRFIYGSRQAKKCLRTCSKCADSDHPPHTQSIIRAFALYSYILWYPMLANSEDPDQTARMRIWSGSTLFARTCLPRYLGQTSQQAHNVEKESIQRWFNVLTLNQRWIYVVSTLCAYWDMYLVYVCDHPKCHLWMAWEGRLS